METIGYLGGLLLAICGIPEVIRTIKDGSCHLGWAFLLLWFFGEVFMITYAFHLADFPLIFNYTFNIILVGIMLYYKIFKNLKNGAIFQGCKREKTSISKSAYV